MRFTYKQLDRLPALSWLAEIKKDSEEIHVIHGSMVECKDEFFVSGVWDGDFSEGDFLHSDAAHCTGGKLQPGGE